MKTYIKKLSVLALLVLSLACLSLPAFAAEEVPAAPAQTGETQSETASKAMPAAIAVGLAAAGGAIAMGLATFKAVESIARQPEAEGKIRTTMMLGLVFIETAIIYALLVVILIIFVL